jgi:hypothetical protein
MHLLNHRAGSCFHAVIPDGLDRAGARLAQDMLGEGFFDWCTIDFYKCPFNICSRFLCTAHSLAVLDNCFVNLVRCKGEGYVRCTGKVSMTAGAHTATGESLDVLSVFYVF